MKNIIIATIHSWNIKLTQEFASSKAGEVHIITEKENLTLEKLKLLKPEYIFFPHWSWIIPSEIYENFNCIVFHMTDLPFGRGGSPLQNLLERKIYKTKISAIKCSKVLDGGDIYLKRDFDISNGSAQEIHERAAKIVFEMINEILQTNPIPVPQTGEIIEFKRRNPKQSDISNLNDLESVFNYIRMLDAPNYPHAFIECGNLRYEFFNVVKDGDKLKAEVSIFQL